jgi:hypothetical protein
MGANVFNQGIGGGGGGAGQNPTRQSLAGQRGANGAVRILWGYNRKFPNTNVLDMVTISA